MKRTIRLIATALCWCMAGGTFCYAQNVLSGHLLDSLSRSPIVGATVIARPTSGSEILSFAMSDTAGCYLLKGQGWPDSLAIIVQSLGTKSLTRVVRSDVYQMDFLLEEETFTLNEVSVKAPSIRQQGDTISYYVSSFKDSLDRTIGEVLRKLPGVQVLSSGKILYQNKEISKFYVDDMDLLQGKYGIATNNLDASKVSTIQILEKHQPIKVLKGMDMPTTAAINLKLKDNARGAFFGTLQLGLGGMHDLLTSDEAVAMRFSKKQQDILLYKFDNTGRDPVDELTTFYGGTEEPDPSLLSPMSTRPTSLEKRRYLFNTSHAATFSDLRLLGKGYTLTTNATFLSEASHQGSASQQDVFLTDADTIAIIEQLAVSSLQRGVEADLFLEKNDDKRYLGNRLKLKVDENSSIDDIVSPASHSQMLRSSRYAFSDAFQHIVKRDDHTLRTESSVSALHYAPTMMVHTVFYPQLWTSDSLLDQTAQYGRLQVNASVREYRDLQGGWYWSYKVGLYGQYVSLQTLMSQADNLLVLPDSLCNDLRRKAVGVKGDVGLGFSRNRYGGGFFFPIDLFWMRRQNEVAHTSADGLHALPAPKLYGELKRDRYTVRLDASHHRKMAGIEEEMTGYLLDSYRSMRRSGGTLPVSSETDAEVGFFYKHPETAFFSSVILGCGYVHRNTMLELMHNGMLRQSFNKPLSNNSTNRFMKLDGGKVFDQTNTTLKMNVNLQQQQSKVLCQGTLADCVSQTCTVSPALLTMVGRHFGLDYQGEVVYTRHRFNTVSSKAFLTMNQKIATTYMPVKRLAVKTSLSHVYNSSLMMKPSAWFGDVGLTYKQKKVEYILEWTNVFNNATYSTYYCSDVCSYSTAYTIRPSEVLLRVKFSL